ncbi:MAG: hypothetical protein ACXVB1_07790 [Pseudobdellovibrionaceae bacterium]
MCFKRNLCFFLSVVLGLTSCTPKIGEAPPQNEQQKLSKTQCLSGLQEVVDDFIAGEATDAAVISGWDCASTAIKTFKKYVYGRADDRFEAIELADFIEKNFLKDTSSLISPTLREEMMRIKQLFLGGSIEYVTRAELDKIVSILGDLKEISLHLNPYMRLITQKWTITGSTNIQKDITYFEKASEEIQNAAKALANIIIENNQSYELDHVITFLREFSDFTGHGAPIADEIEKEMPVIKKIKKAISGGNPNSIGPTDWKSFVLLGARGYLQYLRYFYFIKSAAEMGSSIRLGYLARSLEDLLGAFQDLVEQKPKDSVCGIKGSSCISKQEITDLLKTFSDVWKEFQVSDKLINEIMRLKKVYFGGSDETITSRDFERGKNKVGGLKLVVEKFLPYFQVYSLEWDRANFETAAAEQFFADAQMSLQTSAEKFWALLEEAYSLDNLTGLLEEIDRLYPNKDSNKDSVSSSFSEVKKMMPLLKDLKNIIFSVDSPLIEKDQWSLFFKFSAKFYNAYLLNYYFLKQEAYGSSPFLGPFKKLSDQILTIVNDVTQLKKNKTIPWGEVSSLVKRMVSLDLLPKSLAPDSIDELVKASVNRILWPAKLRLQDSIPNGITPLSTDYLRSEIEIWYQTEKYLYSQASSSLNLQDLAARVAKKLTDPTISAELKTGLDEVSRMLAGGVPQPIDSAGRLIITNIGKLTYNTASVARLNLNRLVGRILISATTTDLDRLKNYEGVNLKEAQDLFDLVRPAVVDVGLLEENNLHFMESRFREANIFSAHSNGDGLVNFPEMTDMVGMILSGVTLNNMFRKDILASCVDPANTQKEIYVQETCFRKVYLNQTANYMTATPEYLKYFKNMNSDEYSRFLENILKAAGYIPNKDETVNLLDADLVPHVFQYLEMTIAKFDANKSGIIDLDEAYTAFPSFKGILVELTKDQSLIKEEDLLALFIYILHYGKPPDGVTDYLFKWLPWKSDQTKWEVSADRGHLAGILGYIADQVAKNEAKKLRLISKENEDAIRNDPHYKGND